MSYYFPLMVKLGCARLETALENSLLVAVSASIKVGSSRDFDLARGQSLDDAFPDRQYSVRLLRTVNGEPVEDEKLSGGQPGEMVLRLLDRVCPGQRRQAEQFISAGMPFKDLTKPVLDKALKACLARPAFAVSPERIAA